MSISRTTARRALGREIGPYMVLNAIGGSTTTIQYLSPFQSTELPSDSFAYQWAYCPTSGLPRLRRITATGLNAGTATLTVDGPFGTAVGSGVFVELSAKLPPGQDFVSGFGESTYLGINECLNLAARHLLVDQDDLSLSLVSDQRDYSLSSWPWIDRDDRLADVRSLDAAGGGYVSTHHRWELRPSGKGATLHFPTPYRFSSGSYSAHLVVRRPADTLIKIAGVWTDVDSGTGMAAETDECGVELNQLLPVAKVFAYASLRDRSHGAAADRYQALYEAQLREARGVHNYDASNDIDSGVSGSGPTPADLKEAA